MEKAKKKRIVFVCTGNTCRSPMAQYLMRKVLKEEGNTSYTVTSCGIAANVGAPISQEAATVLSERGIKSSSHKAKAWRSAFAKPNTLVVVMTHAHKARLPYENVYSFDELTGGGDVSDPFGGIVESYRKTRDQLEAMCRILYRQVLS